jgi:uncharacterized membrane protein HdeD (DUF308 family)
MTSSPETAAAAGPLTLNAEIQAISKRWIWFLLLGLLMVGVGTATISWSCLVTITVLATSLLGFVMLGVGIGEILSSFTASRWSGTMLHILLGCLYGVAGFVIIDQPAASAIQLTLVAAIFLMVSGAARIVSAVVERFTGWGWVFLNGLISLGLGISIYKQWPVSGLWVIGMFLGIEMIFNGWAWIMLALGLRRLSHTSPSA